eukprot:1296474-Rhodomonas_salina.1
MRARRASGSAPQDLFPSSGAAASQDHVRVLCKTPCVCCAMPNHITGIRRFWELQSPDSDDSAAVPEMASHCVRRPLAPSMSARV